MSILGKRVLTSEKMGGYEELGLVHAVLILTPDNDGGDEFPPPSRSVRLKSERVRGAPDRAVGNVFHARA